MLKINNLKKKYAERTVLDIESLEIGSGETVVVVGPNGSGKSTLLKILSGTVKADSGEFLYESEAYYLPQQSVPFGKSVRKNLIFSMKDKKDSSERCEKMLTALGLNHLADKNARGLSGGECQRLALGRLLVNDCELLLLDEPTSAADIEGTELIEATLKEYKKRTGCTILMTTHSPGQARALADRIIILYEGRIIEQGSPAKLLSAPETQWGKKFIDMWKIDV